MVLDVASAVGNAALAIQAIVADPASAAMDLLGALTGGVGKEEADMSALADTRRALGEDNIVKIGSTFKALDTKLQTIVQGVCAL